MGSRSIYVTNKSKHDLEVVGKFGTSIEVDPGKVIVAGSEEVIGHIDEPNMISRPRGNWGWFYVRDRINMATFELFVRIKEGDDKWSIGLLANCSHRDKNPTPNKSPLYFDTSLVRGSFYFTIKSTWTDQPPSYVFNYGHYSISNGGAAHSFIIARSFNGDKMVNFECWGGVATPPSDKPNLCWPAMTFLGNEYELALARTICCFDPNDERTDYDCRHIDEETKELRAKGKLKLGDCCGIIYGKSGVCHQMANRICAAFTHIDAGDQADMASYNISHSNWNTYGGKPLVDPEPVKCLFPDIITDGELKKLKIDRNTSPFLYCTWDDYFNECKRKVNRHPGLAVFKDKLYSFHQGSGDSKELWYATFDEKNWIDTQIKGVGLSVSPAAIAFKDKLYCFYEDSNNSGKLYYTTTSDGKIWITPSGRTDEQIKGVKVSGHPGLAVFKDKLYCFHRGFHRVSGDSKELWYATFDEKNWMDTQIEGVGLSDSPAAIVFKDKLYCFYEASNNSGNLYYTTTSDGKIWITPSGRTDEQIKGVKVSGHPGLAVFKDKLYCFYQDKGDRGKLWYTTTSDGKTWSAPSGKTEEKIEGIGLSGSPAAIVFKDGLYCFYVDRNNNLEYCLLLQR